MTGKVVNYSTQHPGRIDVNLPKDVLLCIYKLLYRVMLTVTFPANTNYVKYTTKQSPVQQNENAVYRFINNGACYIQGMIV